MKLKFNTFRKLNVRVVANYMDTVLAWSMTTRTQKCHACFFIWDLRDSLRKPDWLGELVLHRLTQHVCTAQSMTQRICTAQSMTQCICTAQSRTQRTYTARVWLDKLVLSGVCLDKLVMHIFWLRASVLYGAWLGALILQVVWLDALVLHGVWLGASGTVPSLTWQDCTYWTEPHWAH